MSRKWPRMVISTVFFAVGGVAGLVFHLVIYGVMMLASALVCGVLLIRDLRRK